MQNTDLKKETERNTNQKYIEAMRKFRVSPIFQERQQEAVAAIQEKIHHYKPKTTRAYEAIVRSVVGAGRIEARKKLAERRREKMKGV